MTEPASTQAILSLLEKGGRLVVGRRARLQALRIAVARCHESLHDFRGAMNPSSRQWQTLRQDLDLLRTVLYQLGEPPRPAELYARLKHVVETGSVPSEDAMLCDALFVYNKQLATFRHRMPAYVKLSWLPRAMPAFYYQEEIDHLPRRVRELVEEHDATEIDLLNGPQPWLRAGDR